MYDQAEPVISVDPFRCRMWRDHEHFEHRTDERMCRDLIESILAHGQLLPVLGRRLHGEAEYDIELVYGARRLFAARFLRRNLLVRIKELSDREAVIALDVENCQRKDLSPYERGLSYARWLRAGHFQSQEEIARTLHVSPSQVSRLLKIARLPSAIVAAFGSALDICESWAVELTEAIQEPVRRKYILQRARALSSVPLRPSAKQVYRQLLAPAHRGRRCEVTSREKIVTDADSRPLFRIKRRRGSIALIFPAEVASAQFLSELKHTLMRVLEPQPHCDSLPSKTRRSALHAD